MGPRGPRISAPPLTVAVVAPPQRTHLPAGARSLPLWLKLSRRRERCVLFCRIPGGIPTQWSEIHADSIEAAGFATHERFGSC